MVAGGIGWAPITPLRLLPARADPAVVVPLLLPNEGFDRELMLVAPPREYGALPPRIARAAAEILRAEWRPQLGRLAPWLVGSASLG